MKRKPPIKKIKKDLWELISHTVRRRDCFRTTGTLIQGRCVTCDRMVDFRQLQAGHFIPAGSGPATKYDLKNIHAQCYHCNCLNDGAWPEYEVFMIATYGKNFVDELKKRRNLVIHRGLPDYLTLMLETVAVLEKVDPGDPLIQLTIKRITKYEAFLGN